MLKRGALRPFIENIVFNELKSRGYSVDVGFVERRIINKENKWVYAQSTVPGSFKKILVLNDNIISYTNDMGILVISLEEFLLNKNSVDL